MSKIRVTLEADSVALIKALRAIDDDAQGVGSHIVGPLMTGEIGRTEEFGLAAYGITVLNIERNPGL